MESSEIEKIELDLFLETLFQRYGYDFRHYARASVRRRARHLLARTGYTHLSEMLSRLIYDEDFAKTVIYEFSITVTEIFRDPEFYNAVRQIVIPYLKTYPFFKVWIAGCATGEEVYSLAILLREEGLYDRATIFATDFNEAAMQKAQEGIYSLKDIQQYTANYQKAGGTSSFSDYYYAQYDSVIMHQWLKTNVKFKVHNLVNDGIFNEAQLIFCRNVLIYFDRSLQNWVLTTLSKSLSRGGFLCLGTKETLEFSTEASQFKLMDAGQRIYQKRIQG